MGKMYRRWDKFEVQDVIARYLSGEDVQAIAEILLIPTMCEICAVS